MQLSFDLGAAPAGLVYLPDFIDAAAEAALLTTLATVVAGLSLGASGTLQLRRRQGDGFERWSRALLPRSLYVIGGAARSAWQHMLAPVAPGPDRWSLTFRTLRSGGKPSRATLRRAGAG